MAPAQSIYASVPYLQMVSSGPEAFPGMEGRLNLAPFGLDKGLLQVPIAH